MLPMRLRFSRLGTTESGAVSLLAGGFATGLACFGGALLVGSGDLDGWRGEELGARVTLLFAVLVIGSVVAFVASVIA